MRTTHVALVSVGLLLGTAGCNGFLTGDKLSTNPNLPSVASAQQLLIGVQASQFAYQEGTVAMMVCMWVQSCGAANGRFVEQAGRYIYGEGSNIGANPGDWALIYDSGGLIDIRLIEAAVQKGGDSTFLGIAKIWEAFTMASAADMWGSLPYSKVGTSATPDTDTQFAVYAAVQALLSQAIAELGAGAGAGPGAHDLVFGGDRPSWTAVAYTLKARYWLHVEEAAAAGKLPGGLTGPAVYDSALNAATLGIADATGAHDFRGAHTTATSERNMWAQFQTSSGFGGDLEAGKPLVDLMNARADPRLPLYFCKNGLGGYGGDDFNVPPAGNTISSFACQPLRFSDAFGVPYVTYSERELILAEASSTAARGVGGTDATALTHLNNVRAVPGEASGVSLTALPALAGITGAALFDSIMTEKKIVMFQNIETIMDYRRTCLPAITPVVPNANGFTKVPGELFYPPQERRVNAAHIPTESQEIASGLRTEADINVCP